MREIRKILTTEDTKHTKLLAYIFLRVLLFLLLFASIMPLFAQEVSEEIEEPLTEEVDEEVSAETEEEAVEEEIEPVLTREMQIIEGDIKSSTLGELAVWCRTLGLSEGGTREELTKRIREYYEIPEPSGRSTRNKKEITIESAQTTHKFTIDVINEDYARLRGDVYITLKDGNSIHRIKASDILFNTTRNIITASGGVVYEKVDADKTETFRGENITVNIDNWASVFLDGSSTMESEGTSYLFSGKVISRTDQDVTILRQAEITSTVADEAYWSISASKLWLLPGSDFAIFNAVLKVGEIPVLYIPFFFFPTDQLIFHPVIGYRSREGGFVQTTTYILGQPKSNPAEASSLSRILGNSNDMQLEREGLFLRSTGKKVVDPNEISLKAMIDYYVNLGAYFGIDLAVPKRGILNPLDFTLGIGLTRTVSFLGEGQYTPYNMDGSVEENHSNLFSVSVPFRYRMRFKSSISGSIGTLTWDFPFYSDPFVDRDFLNRAESMDWMNMLQQGAAVEDTVTPETELQSYSWHVTGNINRAFTLFAPYISRMALNTMSTTLSFKKIEDKSVSDSNPNRYFFAPDKWTIISLSGAMSGNPLSLGSSSAKPADTTAKERRDPLFGIGTPISPWPETDKNDDKAPSPDVIAPPVLRQTFTLPSVGRIQFFIDYSFSPNFSSELQFMNALSANNQSRWNSYEDVDWAVQSVVGNFGFNAAINLRMSHSSGLFSNTVSITGYGTWRDYYHINEEYFEGETEEDKKEKMQQMRRLEFAQTNYHSSLSYNGSLQPFFFSSIFKQTNISYTLRGTLVRSQRHNIEKGSPKNGPELTPVWFSWVKEETKDGQYIPGLNSHQLAANLAASFMNQTQTVSFSYTLPPLDEVISTGATFRLWWSETNITARMEKLTDRTLTAVLKEKGKAEGDWLFNQIVIRETVRFASFANLNFSMNLDPEEKGEVTTITSNLSLWELRISFSARKAIKSEFKFNDNGIGGSWSQDPDKDAELLASQLSLAYAKSFSNIEIVKNWVGMSINLNTSLTYDLQQYTKSNFQFSLGMTFKIAGFLDLTLSATSENKVIWRYFKNIKGMEKLTEMYPEGRQNNPFLDFFDSFSFADTEKRERSGFKMKNFNITATHYLGDWTASLTVSMYPRQFSAPSSSAVPFEWRITSDVSFTVQWTPIAEVKTNIKYDGQYNNGKGRWTVE